jgi:hypothetical protein
MRFGMKKCPLVLYKPLMKIDSYIDENNISK